MSVVNSSANRVGGVRALETGETVSVGNTIAFNAGAGVRVASTDGLGPADVTHNVISRNAIHGNGGLGIDLSPASEVSGVTPNDPRDADVGPNLLQNFPVITRVEVVDTATQREAIVHFMLHSEPNRTYQLELFASPETDPSGHGEGARCLTTLAVTTDANGNAQGRVVVADDVLPTFFTMTATGAGGTSEFSRAVRGYPLRPMVVGRHVFYNNSGHDGGNPAANADDDNAIATTVQPLLPGRMADWAKPSFTNYARGLNGVMIDVAHVFWQSVPVAEDFEFRVGNDPDPSAWEPAPAPAQVTIRRGEGTGGSDRVTITWPDGAIRDEWLQVTVKATDRTRLPAPDVFYFGNLVGETGVVQSDYAVTPADLARVRGALGRTTRSVEDPLDVNRDRAITVQDYAIVRANLGRRIVNLRPPTATTPVAAAALEPERVWDEAAPDVLPA